jgi:stage III sporulation protein AF
MVENLSNWASTIVAITILTTITQMILPNNKNKKYVELVCGLLVVIVIMKPVLSFFDGEIDLEKILLDNEKLYSATEYSIETEKLQNAQKNSIIEAYKEKLKEDINSRINAEGYSANDMNIKVNENDFNIKEISFKLEPINKGVQDVVINVSKNISSDTSDVEKSKIKAVLTNIYEIQPESINIY